MAQQRASVEGSGGGKKPTRRSTNPLVAGFKAANMVASLPANAAIKAAKSAADLAKMGYKIVPIPGKKKK